MCFPFHVADGGSPSANEFCDAGAVSSLVAMCLLGDYRLQRWLWIRRLRGSVGYGVASNERSRKGGQGHEVPAGCRHWRQPMKTSVAVVPPHLQSRSDGIRPALGFNPTTISAQPSHQSRSDGS